MYNKQAMDELKTLLLKIYPKEIEKIILYGSRAENRETKYSDYDILLILNNKNDKNFEESVLDITYDVILKNDIIVDLKMITNAELKTIKGCLPYIQSALKNGVEI
jgi:predicted nucleotidyltransferase